MTGQHRAPCFRWRAITVSVVAAMAAYLTVVILETAIAPDQRAAGAGVLDLVGVVDHAGPSHTRFQQGAGCMAAGLAGASMPALSRSRQPSGSALA